MSVSFEDSSDAELFANYDSEYQLAYNEIMQKKQELATVSPADKQTAAKSISRAIDEAYEIIDQMAVVVQSIPSNARASFNAKLRNYRTDIDRTKRELRQMTEGMDRESLFQNKSGSLGNFASDVGYAQRQQLLSTQQRLEESSERLRESHRIANETEGIGASILTDLHGQREQIINSRNTLAEADSHIDKSLRTLRTMARRMAANKVITSAIIAVLVLLIVFVIISKFF